MAVEAEKLIVQALDQRQPQAGRRPWPAPAPGLVEQLRGDAHRQQLASRSAGLSRRAWSMALRKYTATESLSRMAVFAVYAEWQKVPGCLNRSGIGCHRPLPRLDPPGGGGHSRRAWPRPAMPSQSEPL
jgi:hypothetical protein